MIPVKPLHSKAEINQKTPVAAEQGRALSDLKEAMRNEEPHMPLKKKKIAKRHSVKRLKTRKSRPKSVKRKNSSRKLVYLEKSSKLVDNGISKRAQHLYGIDLGTGPL